MNDPHVQALYYNLIPREGVSYKNPPAVSVTQPAFNGELRDNQFIAHMIQHFPTCDEARGSVDAYLKSWEITASLKAGYQEFTFAYAHCDVIDRDPPPPGTIRGLAVTMQGRITVSSSATVSIARGSYPEPPPAFSITPLVEMLWNRHRRFASGNEPLFSMAYFCLTALERSSGGRREAAARYNIEFTVLDKIGELSSTRGGAADARKVVNTVLTPVTPREQEWVNSAVRAMILQVGTVEAGACPDILTMAMLPNMSV